jgi:hypothetical protein
MAQILFLVEDAYSQQQVHSPRLLIGHRTNSDKDVDVALNPPNQALAALVEHAESSAGNKRRLDRSKAVLPVRISGNDISGEAYSELVHTLDVSRTGVRLGAVRRRIEVGSQVVLQYRQHKAEFRVVWTKPVGSGAEQQIGLEAGAQKDLWGLESNATAQPQAPAPAPNRSAAMRA